MSELDHINSVRYCGRCMRVLPLERFIKGNTVRKSCYSCRERNRQRFAQQKAERSVAAGSVATPLAELTDYVRSQFNKAAKKAVANTADPTMPPSIDYSLLVKVILPPELSVSNGSRTPRMIADIVAQHVGRGDGYVWQAGASYMLTEQPISHTFHYRCSLRTDPAKRRCSRQDCGQQGSTTDRTAVSSSREWHFLDYFNCNGLVKISVATDLSYVVVTAEHRLLHCRPNQTTPQKRALLHKRCLAIRPKDSNESVQQERQSNSHNTHYHPNLIQLPRAPPKLTDTQSSPLQSQCSLAKTAQLFAPSPTSVLPLAVLRPDFLPNLPPSPSPSPHHHQPFYFGLQQPGTVTTPCSYMLSPDAAHTTAAWQHLFTTFSSTPMITVTPPAQTSTDAFIVGAPVTPISPSFPFPPTPQPAGTQQL